MQLKPGFKLTEAIGNVTPKQVTEALLPYMMPHPVPNMGHIEGIEYVESAESLRTVWIDSLFCIPAELLDENDKYIGTNTFADDVFIVDIGFGIVFRDGEASFCFEAFDCTHTCHWRIDKATGEGTCTHVARDAAGNERRFKVWHRLSARTTNVKRRTKGFKLPH